MSIKPINFAFFGTPDVAAETLEILKQKGLIPSFIITSPDRPQGRKMLVTPPPVKVWADQNNLSVLQPESLKELEGILSKDNKADMFGFEEAFNFDLFIVVAYGKIFPEWLINTPKYGTLNIHYSLLPKYRGASPVQSAILNGEKETGVTIQKMVKELDAGDIIAQEKIEIGEDEKTPELLARLIETGGELLAQTLPNYIAGKIKPVVQDKKNVSLCQKIKKEDGLLDLDGNAKENYNKFKAYAIWPRTYFMKNGKRNIITDAELKNGKFTIKKIIPESGKETNY